MIDESFKPEFKYFKNCAQTVRKKLNKIKNVCYEKINNCNFEILLFELILLDQILIYKSLSSNNINSPDHIIQFMYIHNFNVIILFIGFELINYFKKIELDRNKYEQDDSESEQDGSESEQDDSESEQDDSESEQDGSESEQDGSESEQDGSKSEQESNEPEQDGSESEQESNKPEQNGSESEQESNEPEQNGSESEQDIGKSEENSNENIIKDVLNDTEYEFKNNSNYEKNRINYNVLNLRNRNVIRNQIEEEYDNSQWEFI